MTVRHTGALNRMIAAHHGTALHGAMVRHGGRHGGGQNKG
jgi:hypothetical protein